MKSLKEFKIPFTGLKETKHQFDFKIDTKFFDAFDYTEFDEVDFSVTLLLNKKETLLELSFVAEGYVRVPCDVTGEDFNMDVKGDFSLIVKFGETYNDDNDELLILPHGAYEIEVQQYVYELILLSIPQKRIKPNAADSGLMAAKQPKNQLEQKQVKKDKIDPRWDQLKQLLDKK